jgi:ketosteroid isomerase-like protein
MKSALPPCRAWITVSALFMVTRGFAAASAADPAAAESAVRKADTDWAAAARADGIDAWTAFYAADAIVLLPHEQLASGRDPVRRTVARFLALPHLSVESRPGDGKMAVVRSGDLALSIGGYELRFDGPQGAHLSDRGQRLEIWKRQPDGSWKCIVDTWTSDDEPTAAASPAPPAAAAPAADAPAPETGPPAPRPESATTYGDMPTDEQASIRKYFLEHLKHPESVRYREITQPQRGYTTETTGGLLMREKRLYGWVVKATIDAQDSRGSYVGPKAYTFLFRGEKITDIRLPLPGDETRPPPGP